MILEFLYFHVARTLANDKNFERCQKTVNENLEREKWRVRLFLCFVQTVKKCNRTESDRKNVTGLSTIEHPIYLNLSEYKQFVYNWSSRNTNPPIAFTTYEFYFV